MRHVNADHPLAPIIAGLLGAALVGATLMSPATNVAWAQTEPSTAANGVLLPPADFDPAAVRNEDLAESAVVPATSTAPVSPAGESIPAGTPEAGNSMTTILGGSDVAVSSVGGSYEVDRPSKRSERKK
jgi:hypothetical protein